MYSTHRRTSSCPDLSIYRPRSEPARKRAQSLFYHVDDEPEFLKNLNRVQSDGDLNKIDRNRPTDESNLQLQPTELLARVFTALGNIKAADDEVQSIAAMSGGFHGLSDSQILASEKQHDSNWSLPFSDSSYAVPPPKARGRAASDFRAPIPDQLDLNNSHDWTWSGNNQQIEEFMRLRKLNKKKSPDLYRAALTSPKVENPIVSMEEGMFAQATQPPDRARSSSIFGRFNPFKKRDDSRKMSLTPDRLDVNSYLDHTSAGRDSRISVPPFSNNITPAVKRRTSTYSMMSITDEGSADVLENTTIADLLRALESMHTQAVTTGDASMLDNLFDNPRPRLGSSSSMVRNSTIRSSSNQHAPPLINVFPPSTPTQRRDRRNSLRPVSTSNTPLFYRMNRRQSAIVDLPSTRRSSLLVPPSTGPPPYSEATPRTSHRRFSVRPTLLSIPPGQSPLPSIQATSTLQRRLSTRPSPLLTDYTNFNQRPNRFGRSISTGSSNHSVSPLETSPVVNRNTHHLAPVPEPEIRLNVPQVRRTSRPQLLNANLDRKRSESK